MRPFLQTENERTFLSPVIPNQCVGSSWVSFVFILGQVRDRIQYGRDAAVSNTLAVLFTCCCCCPLGESGSCPSFPHPVQSWGCVCPAQGQHSCPLSSPLKEKHCILHPSDFSFKILPCNPLLSPFLLGLIPAEMGNMFCDYSLFLLTL